MNLAFKTVANAIELAIIASLTALMQACKRCAASLRVSDSIKMFGRGSRRAACISRAKIFSRVWLHPRLHELYPLVYDCTFGRVSLGFYTDA